MRERCAVECWVAAQVQLVVAVDGAVEGHLKAVDADPEVVAQTTTARRQDGDPCAGIGGWGITGSVAGTVKLMPPFGLS